MFCEVKNVCMDNEYEDKQMMLRGDADSQVTVESIEELTASVRNIIQNVIGDSLKIADSLNDEMRPVIAHIKFIMDNVQEFRDSFANEIKNILNSEVKEESKRSWKKWAEYGWTMAPMMPLGYFEKTPANIDEANLWMKTFCNRHAMEMLFEDLRKTDINKEDLESAIFCYNNKQYKACALILFGIIDAKLICKQGNGETYRAAGIKATKKLHEKFKNGKEKQLNIIFLRSINTLRCLEKMFEKGDNFIKEPDIINRNFISHGMNTRSVCKRDCIQIFLLVYNSMWFIDEV